VTLQILCEFYSIVTNPRRVLQPRSSADPLAAISDMLDFLRVLPVPVNAVDELIALRRRRPVSTAFSLLSDDLSCTTTPKPSRLAASLTPSCFGGREPTKTALNIALPFARAIGNSENLTRHEASQPCLSRVGSHTFQSGGMFSTPSRSAIRVECLPLPGENDK
jgi:hypothetical protein